MFEYIWIFLRAFFLGYFIAIPVGPIGLIILRRYFVFGRVKGVLSGMGGATVDAIYSLVASFGLVLIIDFVRANENYFVAVLAVFILFIGVNIFRKAPEAMTQAPVDKPSSETHLMMYFSIVGLTMWSPSAILGLMAWLTALGLESAATDLAGRVLLSGGVFSGSTATWLTVAYVLRHREGKPLQPNEVRLLNRIVGSLLTGFGIFLVISIL